MTLIGLQGILRSRHGPANEVPEADRSLRGDLNDSHDYGVAMGSKTVLPNTPSYDLALLSDLWVRNDQRGMMVPIDSCAGCPASSSKSTCSYARRGLCRVLAPWRPSWGYRPHGAESHAGDGMGRCACNARQCPRDSDDHIWILAHSPMHKLGLGPRALSARHPLLPSPLATAIACARPS